MPQDVLCKKYLRLQVRTTFVCYSFTMYFLRYVPTYLWLMLARSASIPVTNTSSTLKIPPLLSSYTCTASGYLYGMYIVKSTHHKVISFI